MAEGTSQILENDLTSAAVAGDKEALAELLRRHDAALRDRLSNSIAAVYRAALDVEDVLQVTYIEAFLNIRRFCLDGSDAFLLWLSRIAQNNVRDAVRSLDREKRPPRRKQVDGAHGTDSYAGLLACLAGTGTTPSGHFVRDELKLSMDAAIGKLPEVYRTIVTLIDLGGRSATDVAPELKRSRAAIFMLRARAHDHLAELLGDSSRFFH